MLKPNASSKPTSCRADTNWAQNEFARAPLPDQRLLQRLITLATDFAQQPTAPIPQACGSWDKTKAAYRFFDNAAVQPQAILQAHVQATVQRMQTQPLVLCAQDTTTLNYSTHPQTQGLGPIGNNRHKTIGLFLHSTLALTDAPRVHLLVRAQHNRQVAHPQKHVWDFLATRPVSAHLKTKVPRKDGQPGRLATLAIRFTRVTLRPPCLKDDQPPLTVWAVEARELHPPRGATPVCWRLLTTLPVETAEAAVEKVRWYGQRWQIELIHKVLKSGCQVEQRQLETAARLQRVLMLDLIVAWRVLGLCKAGRQTPDGLASDWLSADEWQALWCYVHKRAQPPRRPPTLRQAVRWLAQLGGFLGRRRDGDPGPIVVWRGLHQLRAITAAWKRFGHGSCG
jgi:hypothetical protein